MIDDFPVRLFLLTALLGGAIVTAGALVATARRPWSDWIMAAGAALTTLGLFLTTLVAFDLSDWLQEHGEYPCLGSICMGAMIFAVGFVINQMQDRALARHQRQVQQITETQSPFRPANSLPMTELIFSLALIAGLFVSLLAIAVGILVNPRPGLPKWIMAASCVFLLIGFSGLGTIIIMEQWRVLDWIHEEILWDFTFACLFFSAALFAGGFFWDRIRRCKVPRP